MKYAEGGNLRKYLPNVIKDRWIVKLEKLQEIISGLKSIHQQKLVHCDFHDGNILNLLDQQNMLFISDLGLCKPMEYFQSPPKENNIYGVLPFVAPEVLRGKPYTSASDIYSFSMIMWEFISGIPPFDDKEHNIYLALSICNGERPKIIENTPQCYMDLMKKCWDEDPLKRPDASEISNIIKNWYQVISRDINEDSMGIMMEFYLTDKPLQQKQTNDLTHKSHPRAYHTSRLLDFTEQLNEILNKKEKYSGILIFK